MLNCIFYTLFFSLFLNISFGSLRLSQVNRAFLRSYKGLFEASVITVDEDGEPIKPYYSQSLLKTYVHDYLEKDISRYVTDYLLDVSFYEEGSETPCEENGKARKVKISISANINKLLKYEKSQFYSVKERENYE